MAIVVDERASAACEVVLLDDGDAEACFCETGSESDASCSSACDGLANDPSDTRAEQLLTDNDDGLWLFVHGEGLWRDEAIVGDDEVKVTPDSWCDGMEYTLCVVRQGNKANALSRKE